MLSPLALAHDLTGTTLKESSDRADITSMADKDTNIVTIEGLSAESWEQAKKYAAVIGNVSSLFSSCIRFLMKDAAAGQKTLSSASKYSLGRLLSSPSFKAPIYFAAKAFKGEELAKHSKISPEELAALFSPDELAHLVGMLYVYRRLQRLVPDDEWKEISKLLHVHAQLGGYVGQALPRIGLSWGLLLGTIRHLSWGLFVVADKKVFTAYRRQTKIKKVTFDIVEETRIWGCNHLQVGSLVIQQLGLGTAIPQAINLGLLAENTPDDVVDDEGYRARILWIWIESLKATGMQPSITHKGAYYPVKAAAEKLEGLAAPIVSDGDAVEFYRVNKDDITPATAPHLFDGGQASDVVDAEVQAEIQNLE